MGVERSELELVWPRELFVEEARALIEQRRIGYSDDKTIGFLLDEAFHDGRGLQYLGDAEGSFGSPQFDDPWADPLGTGQQPPAERPAARLLQSLVDDAEQLPMYVPKRYYAARHAPLTPSSPLTLEETKQHFVRLMQELYTAGYLEAAFGSRCVDAHNDSDAEGQAKLSGLIEVAAPLWPPANPDGSPSNVEASWSPEVFLSLVEALFDLVARPRARSWHDYGDEWDYDDFARAPGQNIYLWRVNDLLARSDLGLRLAVAGPDRGLLVRATDGGRDDLVTAALNIEPGHDLDDVEHAIAKFRSRHATRADKRDAVVALARVLENREAEVRGRLTKKDASDLFHIANRFHLRHRDEAQKTDYPDAFLEWLFWWYLATVELTEKLSPVRLGPVLPKLARTDK